MKTFKATSVEDPSENGPFSAPLAKTTAADIFAGLFISLAVAVFNYLLEQKKKGALANSDDDNVSRIAIKDLSGNAAAGLVPVNSDDDKIGQITIRNSAGTRSARSPGCP